MCFINQNATSEKTLHLCWNVWYFVKVNQSQILLLKMCPINQLTLTLTLTFSFLTMTLFFAPHILDYYHLEFPILWTAVLSCLEIFTNLFSFFWHLLSGKDMVSLRLIDLYCHVIFFGSAISFFWLFFFEFKLYFECWLSLLCDFANLLFIISQMCMQKLELEKPCISNYLQTYMTKIHTS